MELDTISKIKKEQQERFGIAQSLLENKLLASPAVETAAQGIKALQTSAALINNARYINQSAFARQLSYVPQFVQMQKKFETLKADHTLLKSIRNDVYFQNAVAATSEFVRAFNALPTTEQNKFIEELKTTSSVEILNSTADSDTKTGFFEVLKNLLHSLENFKKNSIFLKDFASWGSLLNDVVKEPCNLLNWLFFAMFSIGCLIKNDSSDKTESNEK